MALIPWAPSQWMDNLGHPLAFGRLYLYQAGTLIPKVAYQDAAHTVAHTFPIVLDATGRANVWLIDDEAYDLVVHDANDNVLRSVLGIVTNGGAGGGGSTPSEPGVMEVESFPFSEGLLVQDTAEIWRPGGCFCWMRPCVGWSRIKYIASVFPGVGYSPAGRYGIWGWNGSLGSLPELLIDRPLFDFRQTNVDALDIPVGNYRWIMVAMDPGVSGAPDYVRQMGQSFPAVTAAPFPNSLAFIGAHVQGQPFTAWPTIVAVEPKYLVTKWMALGVEV